MWRSLRRLHTRASSKYNSMFPEIVMATALHFTQGQVQEDYSTNGKSYRLIRFHHISNLERPT